MPGSRSQLVNRDEPQSGSNVFLTIDREDPGGGRGGLRRKEGDRRCHESHDRRDPGDGQPAFLDPTSSRSASRARSGRIATDATHPLQNRAFQAQYPPGSIFKLMVAIAGLESGALTRRQIQLPGPVLSGQREVRTTGRRAVTGTLDLRAPSSTPACVLLPGGPARRDRRDRPCLPSLWSGRTAGPRPRDEAKGQPPNPQPKRKGQPDLDRGHTVIASIGQGMVVTSRCRSSPWSPPSPRRDDLPALRGQEDRLALRRRPEEYEPEAMRQ